jgi:ATP-dependent Lon protease
MAECIKCGDYTKFNGGLCLACYKADQKETEQIFEQITENLFDHGVEFRFEFSNTLHDREIKLSNGWGIKMGRGLDYFQSLSENYFQVGANDLDLLPCLETSFDYYNSNNN